VVLTLIVSTDIDTHITEGTLMIFKVVHLCLKNYNLITTSQQVLIIMLWVEKKLQLDRDP